MQHGSRARGRRRHRCCSSWVAHRRHGDDWFRFRFLRLLRRGAVGRTPLRCARSNVLLVLVLCADPLEDHRIVFIVRRFSVVGWQFGLPNGAGTLVSHLGHEGDLFGIPQIHCRAFHFGHMDSNLAVQTGATNANKDAKVGACPSRVLGLAVHALAILRQLQQLGNGPLVALLCVLGLPRNRRH